MAERRRLPILQEPRGPSTADETDEPRPPLHWVAFGTVLIFAVWLPLVYVSASLQAKILAGKFGEGASVEQIELGLAAMSADERARFAVLQAVPGVLALALASFAGGFVVGRFGTGAGPREAALAGIVTAIIASVLAYRGLSPAFFVSAIVTLLVAALAAAGGGKAGAKAATKRRA